MREVRVNYVSVFKGDEVTDHTLFVGSDWQLPINSYEDFFGEKADMKIDLGTAAQFVTFDDSQETKMSLQLTVDPKELW